MNLNDKKLWKKSRQVFGKRKNIHLNLNSQDLEKFIRNWEVNVFSREDNELSEEE